MRYKGVCHGTGHGPFAPGRRVLGADECNGGVPDMVKPRGSYRLELAC